MSCTLPLRFVVKFSQAKSCPFNCPKPHNLKLLQVHCRACRIGVVDCPSRTQVNSIEISFGQPLCRYGVAMECHEVTRCTNFHQFFLLHAAYLFPSPFYLTYMLSVCSAAAILRSKAALFMDVDHGPRRVEYKFTSSPGFSHSTCRLDKVGSIMLMGLHYNAQYLPC